MYFTHIYIKSEMRKLIYLVAFTTLLLSACEKSEENEKLIQQNEYLKFSSKAELLTFLSDHENNTNLARAKKLALKLLSQTTSTV